MNLAERLKMAQKGATPTPLRAAEPVAPTPSASPWARPEPEDVFLPPPPQSPTPPPSLSARVGVTVQAKPDAKQKLLAKTTDALYERLGTRLSDPSMTDEQLRQLVQRELSMVIDADELALSGPERRRLVEEVESDLLGLGPIQPLLDDPTITEVMVNGPDSVFVEHAGRIYESDVKFRDEIHLRQIIDRIVGKIGRRIDESSPLVDARLEDGSRVNAIIAPLAVSGSTLTIRKFSRDALTVPDLIRLQTLTPEIAELISACVQARLNIIVSGGTGTGKTTMLNVLSSFIPADERIISIEDAVELQLQQKHVIRLESRPPNIEGKGEVTIRDLVRNSLRMRPDRIIVGEVRGAEALDMLQAMNTGHDGSLSTVHASSPREALSRLETLVLMAGMDLPLRAIREQIASSIDLIVQLARLRDGTRRVVAISEVNGMEGQTITMEDTFAFDFSAGVDRDGRFLGKVLPTGVRPHFTDRFAEMGIAISPHIFGGPIWAR
ncbi:CpaF family protein [Tessaracoccus oleiagri]|uniref:Pilus assembly protein CpaF n=1 Tax=Tessaracoccus oleiagri TaxID=686624 RepID=A0A1G9JVC0_9ACTN|nr:CpaF family protein [Tessaracoccus oleiagri]SDL41104.1 pilus assembly protein CpaF [Tessaracoccus oleiagri]